MIPAPMYKKILLVVTVALFALLGGQALAANTGETITFNVSQNFDATGRQQIDATLVKSSPNLYFYVDKTWWDQQFPAKKNEILQNLDSLALEFNAKIYPTLTSVFGSEWNPGVDGDSKITILFQNMKDGAAGYFRSNDEYLKLQLPDSNEREMTYLSIASIDDPMKLKTVLAHELMHLIIFNQKNRLQGVQEETWLDEARSDYTSTLLGYDDVYQGSNLQSRVLDFLKNSSDSVPEFLNSPADFASVHLFMSYLVDHYSVSILADSLHSKQVGIASLNEALAKNGVKENFSQIFTNWTIALLLNDCSLGKNYCYLNQNLQNLRISPTLNFLPFSGDSSLSVSNVTKNWAGNWQKIIGGNGDLTVNFESVAGLNFQVPYITVDKNNVSQISFLKLDSKEKGTLTIKDFGAKYNSLILIPSLQSKLSGFSDFEFTYPYTFTASISGPALPEDEALIQKLLAQIATLKKQIADLQALHGIGSCAITSNLSFGLQNNSQVSCLQTFLAGQGAGIYPEGLVTGNFGPLTLAAVKRFQSQYAITPTGFVGPLTRAKITSLQNP